MPNESAHCFSETQGKCKHGWQLLEYSFIYSFVHICFCDGLFVHVRFFIIFYIIALLTWWINFCFLLCVFGLALFKTAIFRFVALYNSQCGPSQQQKICQETSGGEQQGRAMAWNTCGPNEDGCSNISHIHSLGSQLSISFIMKLGQINKLRWVAPSTCNQSRGIHTYK